MGHTGQSALGATPFGWNATPVDSDKSQLTLSDDFQVIALTTTIQVLAAKDMRTRSNPESGHNAIAVVVGGATVEAFVMLFRRVHLRNGSLADVAAEDNLFERDVGRIGRGVVW